MVASFFIDPLSANSDQQQFSPNNIHTLSRDKVMRINKMIIIEKIPWSFIKFSQLILKGNVWRSVWRICMWILGLKGLKRKLELSTILIRHWNFFKIYSVLVKTRIKVLVINIWSGYKLRCLGSKEICKLWNYQRNKHCWKLNQLMPLGHFKFIFFFRQFSH